jgi:hypothetical protein
MNPEEGDDSSSLLATSILIHGKAITRHQDEDALVFLASAPVPAAPGMRTWITRSHPCARTPEAARWKRDRAEMRRCGNPRFDPGGSRETSATSCVAPPHPDVRDVREPEKRR